MRHIPMCNAAESTSWGPPRVGDRMFLLAKDITFEFLKLKSDCFRLRRRCYVCIEQRHFRVWYQNYVGPMRVDLDVFNGRGQVVFNGRGLQRKMS